MTEAETQLVASRTTAHVLQIIEAQIRDFAAAISSTVTAPVALLALADDIRDSLPSFNKPSLSCVAFNPHIGERDAPDRQRATLGKRPDRSGRDLARVGAEHSQGCQAMGPLHAGEESDESQGHPSGELARNVVDLKYELAVRDIEAALADVVGITQRTVSRVKAEASGEHMLPSDTERA